MWRRGKEDTGRWGVGGCLSLAKQSRLININRITHSSSSNVMATRSKSRPSIHPSIHRLPNEKAQSFSPRNSCSKKLKLQQGSFKKKKEKEERRENDSFTNKSHMKQELRDEPWRGRRQGGKTSFGWESKGRENTDSSLIIVHCINSLKSPQARTSRVLQAWKMDWMGFFFSISASINQEPI